MSFPEEVSGGALQESLAAVPYHPDESSNNADGRNCDADDGRKGDNHQGIPMDMKQSILQARSDNGSKPLHAAGHSARRAARWCRGRSSLPTARARGAS